MPRKLVSVVTSASLVLSLVPVPPSVAYADESESEAYVAQGEQSPWEEEASADDAIEEEQLPASEEEAVVPEEQADVAEGIAQGEDLSPDLQAEKGQPADGEAVEAGPLDEDLLDEQGDSYLEWVDDAIDGPLTASEDYDPKPTSNTSYYNPTRTDAVRTSYLHKNANGNVERVEFIEGKLLVETLSDDFTSVTDQRYIATSTFTPSNLASDSGFRWGGFFSGSQYNFVVTGQTNSGEDNNMVVYRITKYTKDWTYVASAELRGANTVVPFDAGTCFMAENGSTLHVRTCHTMYKSSDGYNHQANVHIVIDESSMGITEAEYGVMNQNQTNYGYVSHSFAQRVTNLGGTMYGLDLGDAYPRAVTIKKLGGYYNCTNVLSIQGDTGNNFTGVTLGGFESSAVKGSLLSSGVTIDQSEFSSSNYGTPRDAFIAVTSSSLSSNSLKYLTNYSSSGSLSAGLPKLVKINENRFLVIWSVLDYDSYNYDVGTYQSGEIGYVFVDGNGNAEGSVMAGSAILSKCDPIVAGNYAIWYAQDPEGSDVPHYYGINLSTGELKRVDLREMSNVQASSIPEQTYTGQVLTPKPTLSYNDRTLVEGTDYNIVSYASNTNAGTASITVEGIGRYTGTKTINFTIVPIVVAPPIGATGLTYDGTAITGVIADSGCTLSGTTSATNAGTYTVTAQLKDTTNYCWYDGTTAAKTLTWSIAPASIASAKVTASNKTYTGDPIESAPTVKLGTVTLKAGTDYTVAYANNTVVGTASITVTGKGNYKGTASGSFKITRASIKLPVASAGFVYTGQTRVGVLAGTGYEVSGTASATNVGSYTATAALSDTKNTQWEDGTTAKKTYSWSIEQANISGATVTVPTQTYTGTARKPKPTAKFNGITLVQGTDYTLSYTNNVNVGTATITLNGKGNFKGAKPVSFAINPKPISEATVQAIADQTFTGKALKPKVVVSNGTTTLVSGTDYTVAYTNNVNAGTATATITGKGNFGGTTSVTFKIVPASLTKSTIDAIASQVYTGSALKPSPIVKMGSTTLKSGTDYTVSYKSNVNVGTDTVTVTVTGKGNYQGTKKATFSIEPADIDGATATVPAQTYTGTARKPKPTAKFNGIMLVEGTHYTLTYANNVNVGTATVTLNGKGNFKGTKPVTFTINPKPISKTTVQAIADQTFTGKALKPKVVVSNGTTTLVSGTDYTVAYANNINAGTALVTITGKGNFTGTTSVSFTIKPAGISGASIDAIGSYAYTGAAIKPSPTVTFGSTALKNKTDYVVTFRNNTNVGTATVTVTGKGNYTGTKTANFNIVKGIEMHRLYNRNSGEHFYTASEKERDALVKAGWSYEGIGWTAPETSDTPVYRLYNQYAGDHHYTTSKVERDKLVATGWTDEGIGWYSDDAQTVPLYRQYNPYATTGTHNYTTSMEENDALVAAGWKAEGIGWYGVK